jgi:hypothetical protein
MNIIEQDNGLNFAAYNADCVKFAKSLPDNSIDFSVYSPPFSSLYVYSESVADMGNVATDKEFIEQYRFLVREKFRALRPGRLTAIHVKDLVYYQNASEDGSSGIRHSLTNAPSYTLRKVSPFTAGLRFSAILYSKEQRLMPTVYFGKPFRRMRHSAALGCLNTSSCFANGRSQAKRSWCAR